MEALSKTSQSASSTGLDPASKPELTTTIRRSPAPTSPAASSDSNKTSSQNGGLSSGSKAGIAVGAVAGALFLGAAIFLLCRRRRRKSAPLQVLGSAENASHDQAEKAELSGTEPKVWSRFGLAPKPELLADKPGKEFQPAVSVAELENREQGDTMPELDGQRNVSDMPPESGRAAAMRGEEMRHTKRKSVHVASRETSDSAPTLAGPLPAASNLYPTPQTKEAAVEEETDFEYQARRLQERRAMIAERKRLAEEEEQIAMEEEALRRKKAMKAGRA